MLDEAIAARASLPALAGATAGVRDTWVEDRLPRSLSFVDCTTDDDDGRVSRIEKIPYELIVHNRPAVSTHRVGNIVGHILDQPNVDPMLAPADEVDPTFWAMTLDAAGVGHSSPLRQARWLLREGNHRVLAQHLTQVGVFVRVGPRRTRTRFVKTPPGLGVATPAFTELTW